MQTSDYSLPAVAFVASLANRCDTHVGTSSDPVLSIE